jgi:hypothetical protein
VRLRLREFFARVKISTLSIQSVCRQMTWGKEDNGHEDDHKEDQEDNQEDDHKDDPRL